MRTRWRAPLSRPHERLYYRLAENGRLIYPDKLTQQQTFRIGCFGHLSEQDFAELTAAFIADARSLP
ncbi:aspartate aminotransferase-like enzyme [Sphingomonas vulcanisoli]|uniref:Aspartate aminotransferase-like enzyme n=1 Tax=Sphingomonas vulcanisoli TaxID=1658060 RepID=A0ABX0TTN2_9SPHN|nr:hypothetical protein [Sphingomonas vulcanisoli]NIJ07767.1 aspartate aminotransferase-like enzyme [Sphingomonas vulcanisoli]